MIQGHGRGDSPVIFIGDGGTNECVQSNYALTGSNEIVLNQISGTFRIKDTYRTLLVKEKVNLTDWETYADKVEAYKGLLFDEIKTINPYLLVPLNELAFRTLTGLRNIRKYRGSILPTAPDLGFDKQYKVLPILGPQPFLQQDYSLRWISQIDFLKLPKYLNDRPIPDTGVLLWVARSASALRSFLQRAYQEDGLLVFDIETFCGIPTCISFCFDGVESVTVPFADPELDDDTRALLIQIVAKVLASPIRKVNQNITYDWRILARYGFLINNISGDTALAATCLTPELEKNLGFLVSMYTDFSYHKDEGKDFNPATIKGREQFYLYCAKDSLTTWHVNKRQQEEIAEENQGFVYSNLCYLIPVYKKLEDRGFRVDEAQRQKLLAKYWNLFEIEKMKLKRLTGNYNLNPLSSQQMLKLVFEELGFPKTRQANSTEEEALDWLDAFSQAKHSPILGKLALKSIIACRKFHKVIEYLETVQYPDGRWRCTYNLGGAETGRSKSGRNKTELMFEKNENGKIELIQLGRSFQNIMKHGFKVDGETFGKDFRTVVVPSRGYSFVEVDLSQAEARVDAVLAGNFKILEVFDGPVGIHRLTGSWVYSCDPSEIKKNTDEYHISKTVRHAGERNMQHDRLVLMTQQPVAFCKRILDVFHKFQPEIRDVFHRDIRRVVEATRCLVAPNGRRRQFLARMDERLINEAISHLPQCIVSDQLKFSLIPTFRECGSFSYLLNEAHDGALAEVETGRTMDYARSFRRNVETEIDFLNCSLQRDFRLVIPSEVSMSDTNWYDLKEVEVEK